jgi:hypothetical protein
MGNFKGSNPKDNKEKEQVVKKDKKVEVRNK